MDLADGRVWVGLIEGESFRRVSLYKFAYDFQRWVLLGESGACGKLFEFMDKDPMGMVIQIFGFVKLALAPEYYLVESIPSTRIKMNGIRWLSHGHSIDDSLCGGRADFIPQVIEAL